MPRKQDPVGGVMQYFETAPIDSAKTALSVAQAIVKRRSGPAAPAKKPTARKSTGPGPAPATVGD